MVSTDDIVRSDSKVDDIQVENADIISKFKFFETYKPSEKEKKTFRITPPRDGVNKVNIFNQTSLSTFRHAISFHLISYHHPNLKRIGIRISLATT